MNLNIGSMLFLNALLFIGLITAYAGFNMLRKIRLIEGTPTSKICYLRRGLVEVYGKVMPAGATLVSPLGKKPCVYYSYKVEEEQGSSKYRRWVSLKSGKSALNFYIYDGTGRVLVNPEGAQINLSEDYRAKSGIRDPPKEMLDFLAQNGLKYDGFLGLNKSMRFSEYCIETGSELYVIGTAGDNNAYNPAQAHSVSERTVISKGSGPLFYIADKPKKKVLSSMRQTMLEYFVVSFVCFLAGLFIVYLFIVYTILS